MSTSCVCVRCLQDYDGWWEACKTTFRVKALLREQVDCQRQRSIRCVVATTHYGLFTYIIYTCIQSQVYSRGKQFNLGMTWLFYKASQPRGRASGSRAYERHEMQGVIFKCTRHECSVFVNLWPHLLRIHSRHQFSCYGFISVAAEWRHVNTLWVFLLPHSVFT